MRSALSILFVLAAALEAEAQSAADLPRWDLAGTTGLFVGHPADRPETESFDKWNHNGTLAIAAGHYFSPHFKIEGELAWSGEGSSYGLRLVDLPGLGLTPISSEQLTRTIGTSAAMVWQFFENAWAHPFVLAGATLDFDREEVRTFEQRFYRGDPRLPTNEVIVPARTDAFGTSARLRGLLGAGAKLYIAPQAFFRTDVRVGVGGNGSGHVAFRLGFGADF